jgi:mRNA interferase RelE/StbE
VTFRLIYAERAERQLNKLNPEIALRILNGCERLKTQPFPDGKHVKKLKGYENIYRLRVGDYRIVFRITKDIVEMIDVVSKPDFKKSY